MSSRRTPPLRRQKPIPRRLDCGLTRDCDPGPIASSRLDSIARRVAHGAGTVVNIPGKGLPPRQAFPASPAWRPTCRTAFRIAYPHNHPAILQNALQAVVGVKNSCKSLVGLLRASVDVTRHLRKVILSLNGKKTNQGTFP